MNKYITKIIWPLLLIFMTVPLFAQNGNEQDQTNRDIRIAEGILSELLKESDTENYFHGSIRSVKGEYIPGFGVHFKAASNTSSRTLRMVIKGHAQIEEAEEEMDPSEKREENRAFVEERFMEYLKNYASRIRGVPEEEVIRLSFGARSPVRTLVIHHSDSDRPDTIPSISMWASVADINAYNNQQIDEEEFESRVQVRGLSDQKTEKDQEVFASILETALNQADTESIRIRRSPQIDYLPGMGLHYHINASSGSHRFFGDLDIDNLELQLDSLSIEISNLTEHLGERLLVPIAVKLDSLLDDWSPGDSLAHEIRDSLRRSNREYQNNIMNSREIDSLRRQAENAGKQVERELRMNSRSNEQTFSEEEIRTDIEKIHTELIETVKEYGSTLQSLKEDEMLMITIHWNHRNGELPSRSQLRISKEDLLDGVQPRIEEID